MSEANMQRTTTHSIAYQEGLRARQQGLKLKETAITKLRVGSRQYEDFLAGYDNLSLVASSEPSPL